MRIPSDAAHAWQTELSAVKDERDARDETIVELREQLAAKAEPVVAEPPVSAQAAADMQAENSALKKENAALKADLEESHASGAAKDIIIGSFKSALEGERASRVTDEARQAAALANACASDEAKDEMIDALKEELQQALAAPVRTHLIRSSVAFVLTRVTPQAAASTEELDTVKSERDAQRETITELRAELEEKDALIEEQAAGLASRDEIIAADAEHSASTERMLKADLAESRASDIAKDAIIESLREELASKGETPVVRSPLILLLSGLSGLTYALQAPPSEIAAKLETTQYKLAAAYAKIEDMEGSLDFAWKSSLFAEDVLETTRAALKTSEFRVDEKDALLEYKEEVIRDLKRAVESMSAPSSPATPSPAAPLKVLPAIRAIRASAGLATPTPRQPLVESSAHNVPVPQWDSARRPIAARKRGGSKLAGSSS